jgi:hypothetical protein
MADNGPKPSNPPEDLDPSTALPRTLALLRTKNDTSRFVGLAMLKTLLDNHPSLRDDSATIKDSWAAISPTFLDRLLRATESKRKKSKDEARGMVDLAVSVIHTFAVLLSAKGEQDAKLIGRGKGLIGALLKWWVSSPQRLHIDRYADVIPARQKPRRSLCRHSLLSPVSRRGLLLYGRLTI